MIVTQKQVPPPFMPITVTFETDRDWREFCQLLQDFNTDRRPNTNTKRFGRMLGSDIRGAGLAPGDMDAR